MKAKNFALLMAVLIGLLLLFILTSCSPKIAQYKVVKVNGQRFKVEGKRGVLIAPKDTVIKVGQMVSIRSIF